MNKHIGYLEIAIGPMCSGKTTYLMDKLNNFVYFGYKCLYVNHSIDTRSDMEYSTHNQNLKVNEQVDMVKCSSLKEIESVLSTYDFIGIDEGQFFEDLNEVVRNLVGKNKKVFVGGLSGDYRLNTFGKILELIPFAENVKKLEAFCTECMKDDVYSVASFSKRIVGEGSQVLVGGADMYIPVCRKCWCKV
jgi:thymidine kinase